MKKTEVTFRVVTTLFSLTLFTLFFAPTFAYVDRRPQIGYVLDAVSHGVQRVAVSSIWKGGETLAAVSASLERSLSKEVSAGWLWAGTTPKGKSSTTDVGAAPPLGESISPNVPTIPGLTAKAYLVQDFTTSEVLAAHKPNEVVPIASVSKLLTAVTIIDRFDLSKKTRVSAKAVSTEGQYGELSAGETISVQGLLYALLMESSNDAAEALAETFGRARMLELINDEAQKLGLGHTLFEDPSGLDGYNSSTATDLFTLLQYISAHDPEIIDITKLRSKSWTADSRAHQWTNTNPFVRHSYPGYLGGKHGYTWEADNTFAGLFQVGAAANARPVAIIVLGSSNLRGDVDRILALLGKNASLVAQTALSR